MNTRTTGIDTYHSTMFTLLLELERYMWAKVVQFEWQNSLSKAFVVDSDITLPFSKSVKQLKFLIRSE